MMNAQRVTVLALFASGMLISAAKKPAMTAPPLLLGSADTMEKVFRDEPWTRPPVATLSIQAAKNEVEGVQLVVAGGETEEIRGVTLQAADLVSETGGKISASNVTWRVVGYAETERPAYPVRRVGWWPDPLLPDRTFDVKVGEVQPVWINVQVPPDTAAGLYRGKITVRLLDGREQSVPLELCVWNFAVPKRQHLETCFPLRPDQLKRFYQLPELPI